MRLIHAETLEFVDIIDPSSVDYAILSHTWEGEEVTFQDMTNWDPSVKKKAGFAKIQETSRLARQKGLKYVWIDTCCIDKSSSAELSEAINSMFNWYAMSNVCFAQLSDLRTGVGLRTQDLEKCRWFKRGWTLQELIAPAVVELYDSKWLFRGTKHQHWMAIQNVSGISKDGFLDFINTISLSKSSSSNSDRNPFPVAQRMYWASRRETTRAEDMAYCLFGLFDVNMPLLYGEGGTKAFMRLQSAILEATQDLSILAWKHPQPSSDEEDADDKEEEDTVMHVDPREPAFVDTACGVLAPSPKEFDHAVARHFHTAKEVYYTGADDLGYSVHTDGLLLRVKRPRLSILSRCDDQIVFLNTGVSFKIPIGDGGPGSGSWFPRLWIPLAQLGKVYGRAHASTDPLLDSTTTRGRVPFEEMTLIGDPWRILEVGDQGSSLKFDASLPTNMIIHGLDAAPKDSWNNLTQVFSIPGKRPGGGGYLRIRLRRTDGHSPTAMGTFLVPSWLERIDLLLLWDVTDVYSTWKEQPFETWEFFVQMVFYARRHDSSPPKDWFPRLFTPGGRTHFADEVSVLESVAEYIWTNGTAGNDGLVFVGDSAVNEAVRCRVKSTTITTPNTAMFEKPQRFELKLEVEDMTWAAAVEESQQQKVACMDFRESFPVSVNVQIGSSPQA